jgi:hypothetical protein
VSHVLVDKIIKAAGQPVAGHTMTMEEATQAAQEGRVLNFLFTSTYGDSEATFSFSDEADYTYDWKAQRAIPKCLVFPKPIPLELRGSGNWNWEEIDQVYAAFNVSPN